MDATRAMEFSAQIDDSFTLTIPEEIARLLHKDQRIRVLLLVPEQDAESPDKDSRDWNRLAANQFLRGYAEDDSIYARIERPWR